MRPKLLSLFIFTLLLLFLFIPVSILATPASAEGPSGEGGVLTLLHNNDGESSLLPLEYLVPPDSGYGNATTVTLQVGSVAAFKTVTDDAIAEARDSGNSVVNVYAGDAFLASATVRCSLPPDNEPIYDAIAQQQIPYDAHIFGNHEFDFGPGFLLRFIETFEVGGELTQPFLSANLDFSQAAGYADLIDPDGLIVGQTTNGQVIARSLILTDEETGQTFGIVGATTPILPTISSPGDVIVTTDDITGTAQVVQSEIDRLYDSHGVNRIIFVSHLQDVDNDREIVGMLSRVDVAVAGGGDELLVNPDVDQQMQLLPGEIAPIADTYPIVVQDVDGRDVYIVTTAGNYKYLGRLDVEFDANGEVTQFISASSYPRPVIPESDAASELGLENAVAMDPGILESVNAPVNACLERFQENIAASEVFLDVSRNGVRAGESNAGDLIADGFIHSYMLYSDTNGLPTDMPVVAVQNGGGIRQNAGDILPLSEQLPAPLTRQNAIDVLPFFNYMTAIVDFTPEEMKGILEHSAAALPGESGAFLQVGGMQVTYNIANPVGSRVVSVVLNSGEPLIEGGVPVPGAPNVIMVTNNFTADGGDDYETFANIPQERKTNLVSTDGSPLTYEGALTEYLTTFPETYMGLPTIPADGPYSYPDGDGRITILDAPTAITLDSLQTQPQGVDLWIVAAGGFLFTFGLLVVRRRMQG